MDSHAQLQIIWSVIVDASHFYTREELNRLGDPNEFKPALSPSWWVSTLSPKSC